MNRKELARVMAARRGKTIQEAEEWESAMLDAMADALSENVCGYSDRGTQEDQIYAEPADFVKGKVGYDYEHRGSYCFGIRYWHHRGRLSRADDCRLVRGSCTRR